ncbi:MAG: DNA primase [Selenomonadaceae bacterium]|nr:DNA primase [Selenomonadaceae bacterium]
MGSAELDEFVERVTERTDIYSVVSRYMQLTQKSGRYWGRCPFHNEKTASFSVSADKGLFYCFGCGAGGNVFKFLSLIENITYFEAIKLQAERLGIELPARKASPEEERRRREEKSLIKINEFAQDFYHECLIKTARGEVGRKYLAARGITAETIETFKLGFAFEEWENLLTKLLKQGFSPQQLEAVGLVAKRKNSSGYYDRFRGRVMIPIANVFGHVVGFGGRILGSEDDTNPKYLNTPETALFNKRNLLFGLDKSNRAISTAGAAVVVEGYMDAISLFSAGIKNVVATLGTAFTPEHVKLILRYARKIIFCYDSDAAGQRATVRALPIVQAAGAEVFVVNIPDGKDPDEFIRKHGKAAFEELIKNAATLIDYRMKYVLDNTEHTTPAGKLKALQEILPVVTKVEVDATRNEYRKKIAAALALDEFIITREWKKFLRTEPDKKSAVKLAKLPETANPVVKAASEDILRMVWQESEMLHYALTLLPREIFSDVHREIITWIETCAANERRPDKMSAATELSEAANAELARILMSGPNTEHDVDVNVFKDSVKVLRQIVLDKKYFQLLAQVDNYDSSDEAAYVQTVQKSLKIKKESDNLKSNYTCF